MNRWLKLIIMELARFWKIYAALAAMTFVSQSGGLLLHFNSQLNDVRRRMEEQGLQTYEQYVAKYGRESFHMAIDRTEPFFTGPVFLCIAALIFYSIFIWYRDWAGKNTFIYRLLMLPTSRMNLYWAKLASIMLLVFGLVALQLLLFPFYTGLFRAIVPDELAIRETVFAFVRHHAIYQVLIPPTFLEFILYYGAGLLGLTVVFTAVLIERSYRLKGLIGGIVYVAGAGMLIVSPELVNLNTGSSFVLYRSEIVQLMIGVGAIVFAMSLWISWRLLARKITV